MDSLRNKGERVTEVATRYRPPYAHIHKHVHPHAQICVYPHDHTRTGGRECGRMRERKGRIRKMAMELGYSTSAVQSLHGKTQHTLSQGGHSNRHVLEL